MHMATFGQWTSEKGRPHEAPMRDIWHGSMERNRGDRGIGLQADQAFPKLSNRGLMDHFIQALIARGEREWMRWLRRLLGHCESVDTNVTMNLRLPVKPPRWVNIMPCFTEGMDGDASAL